MSAALNHLGRNPDKPLCVVVPPQKGLNDIQLFVGDVRFWVTDTMEVNPPELVSFWRAFAREPTCIEHGRGGVVELPEGTHIQGLLFLESKIFIRDCYPVLLKICMATINDKANNVPHLVILGNPGIGKTFFGFILLLFLAQSGDSSLRRLVNWRSRSIHPYLVVRGSLEDFVGMLGRPTTYYIVDSIRPHDFACKTILLTSLNRSVWYDFYLTNCEALYMPVWSKDELLACHASVYANEVPIDKVEECYDRWGGIPLYVLKLPLPACHQSRLDVAIASVNLKSIVKACGMVDVGDSHTLHHLLHYHVGKQFRKVHLDFASQYVRDEIFKRLQGQTKCQLLVDISNVGGIASMCDLLDERQED